MFRKGLQFPPGQVHFPFRRFQGFTRSLKGLFHLKLGLFAGQQLLIPFFGLLQPGSLPVQHLILGDLKAGIAFFLRLSAFHGQRDILHQHHLAGAVAKNMMHIQEKSGFRPAMINLGPVKLISQKGKRPHQEGFRRHRPLNDFHLRLPGFPADKYLPGLIRFQTAHHIGMGRQGLPHRLRHSFRLYRLFKAEKGRNIIGGSRRPGHALHKNPFLGLGKRRPLPGFIPAAFPLGLHLQGQTSHRGKFRHLTVLKGPVKGLGKLHTETDGGNRI